MGHSRLVHVGGGDRTSLVSLIHKSHHLVVTVDHELRQVLNVGPQARVFTDPEVARVLGVEEVANLLIVDLDVRYFYREMNVRVLGLLRFDSTE